MNYGSRVLIDIGGEGRHGEAWNVNPRRMKTFGPNCGEPIPRLIVGKAEAVPLPDESADAIVVERTPLTRLALEEIQRIAKTRIAGDFAACASV